MKQLIMLLVFVSVPAHASISATAEYLMSHGASKARAVKVSKVLDLACSRFQAGHRASDFKAIDRAGDDASKVLEQSGLDIQFDEVCDQI